MSNDRQMKLSGRVEQELLPYVRQPARYIGGEINQIKKDPARCELTVALCFPDLYEVGMSHTGLAILYDVLNRLDYVVAERVFAPWIDAEQLLRQKGIHLFSLESRRPLSDFDIVGFSLTNELCYTNVLNMLDLGGIPIRSKRRSEDDPIVIAGGGMANCCEPLAPFIDLFVLGEAEELIVELAELVRSAKKRRAGRREILYEAARRFDCVYVPALYRFEGDARGGSVLVGSDPALPSSFRNAVVEDFENAPVPLRPIVPFVQAVHERVSVEIMRGCPGRCRFCQASFCRRPIRYRSVEKISRIAETCYRSTGFDTVSLLSLSSAEYPHLEQLIESLHGYFADKHVGLSLPSLRVDRQLKLLPRLVNTVRKSGLTIAVEAASEPLREVINKPLKDADLFAAVEAAYRAGWRKLKLYFMVGLPGEQLEDVEQIVQLAYRLAMLRKSVAGRPAQLNITVSWFVPKPHTPFAWFGQRSRAYFEQAKQQILQGKRRLRARFLQFKFHDISRSVLESAIGRGGRELADVIEAAWADGARFDLWDECFDFEIWRRAFERFGIDVEALAQRRFSTDQRLAWDHLGGPKKQYLLRHLQQAVELLGKLGRDDGTAPTSPRYGESS